MTHEYEAALADLTSDARTWEDASETYIEVRRLVANCELNSFEMDGFGKMTEAESNYNTSQELIYTLVDEAVEVFSQISEKLASTKNNYEGADGHAQWLLDQG